MAEANLAEDSAVGIPKQVLQFSEEALNDICRSITLRLGAGLVKVEVTKDHLYEAISQAVDAIMPYTMHRQGTYWLTNASASRVEYDLPSQIRFVWGVVFDPTGGTLFPQGLVLPNFFNFYAQSGDTSTYYTVLAKIESMKKVYGMTASWELVRGHKIRIYPPAATQTIMAIHCITSIGELDSFTYKAIKDYALAETKCILAEIRGKYASVPSSQGQTQLNWERLNSDGKDEKTAVLTSIQMRNPVFFIKKG